MAFLIASLLALAVQDTEPRIFRLIRDGAGVDQLRPMLEKDPELVRARGNLEETPLHDAARFSSLEVVTLLVEKGSDVNKTCYNRFTPLWFACSGGKVDVVKYLLSKGADLEAPSNGGTPLQVAASWKHKDVVKVLLAAGAKYDIESAIHLSDEARIRAILEKEPGLARDKRNLHQACWTGNTAVVALMLAQGANPNEPGDYWGHPPLFSALKFPAIVKLLLDKGADPKARIHMKGVPDGATLLHQAAGGPRETATLLLDAGADVNAILVNDRGEKRKYTPLHVAAGAGAPVMVELMLDRKANLFQTTEQGLDALQLATRGSRPLYKPEQAVENRRRVVTARILEKAGLPVDLHSAIALDDGPKVAAFLKNPAVRLDLRDDEKYTPLQRAVELSRGPMVQALLAAGADVNQKGRDGGTALHSAAFWGLPEMVRILLNAKADVNAVDENRATPLSEALRVEPHADDRKSMQTVIQMLREAGGK